MASGFLAKPGFEFGPCLERCEHVCCQKTRSMADQQCRYCGQKIGFGNSGSTMTKAFTIGFGPAGSQSGLSSRKIGRS